MQFLVTTIGYSFKEWKGSFHPEKLPQKEKLRYFAKRFSTVDNLAVCSNSSRIDHGWSERCQRYS